MLLAVGLFIGLCVPYLWYLDKQVRKEFAALQWQEPTRVFARPLRLEPGSRLDGDTLELELAAAGYRKDGVGLVPGTYARDGVRFLIGTRRFTDLDGPVPEQRLDVQLGGGRVQRVRNASGRNHDKARVDPARNATI
jgi:penicillin-binding protein 1B